MRDEDVDEEQAEREFDLRAEELHELRVEYVDQQGWPDDVDPEEFPAVSSATE